MKVSLFVTAALAIGTSSAFAQTVPPSQPATMVGTATGATSKYSTTSPTPMNSTTDHMGDMNGVQTSSTMTKRQMMRRNGTAPTKGKKTKMKATGAGNSTM